jgi:hypothetical protein
VRDDDRLRALFRELRSREERESPSIDGLLLRPRPAPRRSLSVAYALAAGLAGVVVLALLVRPARPDPGPLSRWRSPTASLLPSPESRLLVATPRVGESWLALPTEVKR